MQRSLDGLVFNNRIKTTPSGLRALLPRPPTLTHSSLPSSPTPPTRRPPLITPHHHPLPARRRHHRVRLLGSHPLALVSVWRAYPVTASAVATTAAKYLRYSNNLGVTSCNVLRTPSSPSRPPPNVQEVSSRPARARACSIILLIAGRERRRFALQADEIKTACAEQLPSRQRCREGSDSQCCQPRITTTAVVYVFTPVDANIYIYVCMFIYDHF